MSQLKIWYIYTNCTVQLIGLKTIPAIIRDYNSIYLSELAILENLQREDLTPIEEAIAFQKGRV